jgi:predicted dehydrogenase
MKIGIIGCGVIGCQRIEAINYISKKINNIHISAAFDINKDILLKVKNKYQVPIFSDINSVIETNPDWIFVCTPNNEVSNTALKAFEINANILVEKPLGRNLSECELIINSKPKESKLYVGFNYRFFKGIEYILNDVKAGVFGKLISVNLILAHGNCPDAEKSWRFDPNICEGCVEDLAVHLFDLILQLSSGDVNLEYIKNWSGFWNTGIKEECHILLSDKSGTIFNTQVSFNRWKNIFKLEINGTEGYGVVEGKGGNYGAQSYKMGKRWGWLSGKPQAETETIIVDNYDCKDSFIKETISVLNLSDNIKEYSLSKPCDYNDARGVMALVEKCNSSLKGNS